MVLDGGSLFILLLDSVALNKMALKLGYHFYVGYQCLECCIHQLRVSPFNLCVGQWDWKFAAQKAQQRM